MPYKVRPTMTKVKIKKVDNNKLITRHIRVSNELVDTLDAVIKDNPTITSRDKAIRFLMAPRADTSDMD